MLVCETHDCMKYFAISGWNKSSWPRDQIVPFRETRGDPIPDNHSVRLFAATGSLFDPFRGDSRLARIGHAGSDTRFWGPVGRRRLGVYGLQYKKADDRNGEAVRGQETRFL